MKKAILPFLFLLITFSASAAVLIDETFNYTTGAALGDVEGWTTTGTLTTGDGRIIQTTPLSYRNAGGEYMHSGVGKSVKHNYAGGENYISYRAFAKIESGAVYLTYMYKPDGKQSQSNGELLGLTTGTSPSARPWVGKIDDETKGNPYRIGITHRTGTGSAIVWGTGEYSVDDVILLVLKYDLTNHSTSLFINPTIGTTEEPEANITDNNESGQSARTKIDAIMFRNTGSSKSNCYIGGVRVSTTWAEAVQAKGELPTDVTLERIKTNFSDGTWGEITDSNSPKSSGAFGSSTLNDFELDAAYMFGGSILSVTGEKYTNRISVDKKSQNGMITLPAVNRATRIDVYASSGSNDRAITLQKYNYYSGLWSDVTTYSFATGSICYRFTTVLNSDEITRLRLVNASNGTIYIWKIVTYPAAATDLEIPEALEATNVSAHAFSARWTAVSNASGYRIVVYKADGKTQTIKEAVADATSFNITSLTPGTNYTYKVSAIGDDENYVDSYLSDVIEVTTAAEITDSYTRTVTNGNYGTICLPKASNDLSTAGAVFFAVAGKVMNGDQLQEIVLEDVTELVAGTPYVFLATANEINIPLTGEAVEDPVNTGTNGLKGSFAVKSITGTENKYILSQNKLYCTNGQVYYVGENRAYFDISSMSEVSETPAPGRRRVYLATEENQVTTEVIDQQSAINVQKKIVDGKIVIIRNGEMYDLTGQRL